MFILKIQLKNLIICKKKESFIFFLLLFFQCNIEAFQFSVILWTIHFNSLSNILYFVIFILKIFNESQLIYIMIKQNNTESVVAVLKSVYSLVWCYTMSCCQYVIVVNDRASTHGYIYVKNKSHPRILVWFRKLSSNNSGCNLQWFCNFATFYNM